MFCTDGECYTHPSTQWGLCRKHPTDEELPPHTGHPHEEEPIMPTGFHFWTPDELRERPPQRLCSPRAASPLTWRASALLSRAVYNAKLHIDEDHPMSRERIPSHLQLPKEEL